MSQVIPPDERPKRPQAARARAPQALVALTCGLAGTLLYFAHAAFIPIAFAVLFTLLLSAPVEALHRRGLPRGASALLILMLFVGIFSGAVNRLWDPAQQWLAAAPHTARVIEQKLGPAARAMRRVYAVTDRASRLTNAPGPSRLSTLNTAAAPTESQGLLAVTRTALVAIVTVIFLTLFMLAAGPPVLARMTASVASDARASQVLKVIGAVRSEVGRYYATIALINIGMGIATALAMWALGMPNPILWGVTAGMLNFIPYVGATMTLVVLTVVAFVSFDSIGRVLAVAGSYIALATVEGQIVQPLFVGQRLELNPIIVFLALWFGGWFWGIAGIIMAVPALVTLKVVAEHNAQGAALVAFLSPNSAKRFQPRQPDAAAASQDQRLSATVAGSLEPITPPRHDVP